MIFHVSFHLTPFLHFEPLLLYFTMIYYSLFFLPPPTQPVFKIIEDLHERTSRFNPGNLDLLTQKAALARVELEALKAESLTTVPLTSHAERVEKLYSAMQAWETVSGSFPMVVQRLTGATSADTPA